MSMSPKNYNRESTVNDMRLCLNNLLTQSDHHRITVIVVAVHSHHHNRNHHNYHSNHKTQDVVNELRLKEDCKNLDKQILTTVF